MRLLEPTAQIWMKIDPYCQRQKCRPMNLVSENIRFMRIFPGVPLGAGVKRHWGLSTTAIFAYLAGYVFENVRDTASNIIWRYATPCRPAMNAKWMTLNDLELLFHDKMRFWPALLESERLNVRNSRPTTSAILRCSVHFTIYMYLYPYCYRRETARQLRIYAQLTRCFSAVAELLVCKCLEEWAIWKTDFV